MRKQKVAHRTDENDNLIKVASDGSTAAYYELPEDAKELQDLISYKNMNAQIGEICRAWYRYGEVEHSEKMRLMCSSYAAAVDKLYTDAGKMNLTKSNNDWEYVWNFKFRTCSFSEADIWPFTKMYTGTHENNAGALFGGPPATIREYATKEAYTFRVLKGELD